MGFDLIIELYKEDPYFAKIYEEQRSVLFGMKDSSSRLTDYAFLFVWFVSFWCVKLMVEDLLGTLEKRRP